MSTQQNAKPHTQLNLLDATMVVVGIMIGSGIFIVSSDIAKEVGSAGWLLVVWLVTGVVTLLGALSYGELGGMYPHAGGQYAYLREMFGPLTAFLYGWTFFTVIQTGSIAAVGVAFGKYLGVLYKPLDESNVLFSIGNSWSLKPTQLVAMAIIIFLTWVNTRGLSIGKLIQNIFTFAKMGSLFGLIALGLFVGYNADVVAQNWSSFWNAVSLKNGIANPVQLTGWGIVIAVAVSQTGSLFSSDGWNNITFAARETKDPQRTIPLAVAYGTFIVTALYLLANVAYLVTLNMNSIATAEAGRVAASSASVIFPEFGVALMAALIMVSTFGCNNGMILAGARCYHAMAHDNLFFKTAGDVNKHNAPAHALWYQCGWACLLCLSGKYGDLLDYVMLAVLLFYIITVAGIFKMRIQRPDLPRPIKAIGFPVLPALYILLCTFIVFVLLIEKSEYTIPGLVIVLLGIPVYYFRTKSNQ
ncbi:MAG: amino acid permease [Candidatus Kapabacteria bacterium]|nr:amino acid permease [Candidatus Kapabacteria bacterium]